MRFEESGSRLQAQSAITVLAVTLSPLLLRHVLFRPQNLPACGLFAICYFPTIEINKMLSTEMDVLRSSARKSRMERIKNESIKETMGVNGKPDIIDILEKKRLQWYGQIKRMPEDRLPKLIMGWIPQERRKRGRPRKSWMEGVQTAMTTRNLEPDQWRNREEWRLVSGSRRQLL